MSARADDRADSTKNKRKAAPAAKEAASSKKRVLHGSFDEWPLGLLRNVLIVWSAMNKAARPVDIAHWPQSQVVLFDANYEPVTPVAGDWYKTVRFVAIGSYWWQRRVAVAAAGFDGHGVLRRGEPCEPSSEVCVVSGQASEALEAGASDFRPR